MTELLCRLFIKDRENTLDPVVRRRYGVMVSLVAIIINLLLFAGKFVVGKYVAFSIAIYADAMNNLADAGSSVISLISFRIASKPADRDHPYGHARMEYITSLLVAFLVLHTAIDVVSESVGKIASGGGGTEFTTASAVILAAAILLKLWLCLFNRGVGKRLDSAIMKANAADSLSDAISTAAVLAATVFIHFFPSLSVIDAAIGVAVGVVIFISGIKIFIETKNLILGKAPGREITESIEAVVAKYPGALGTHDMFVHNYGPGRYIVSMHIEVDGSKDVFETHDMIDNIEKELRDDLGYICTIHMDPIVTDDDRTNKMRELVKQAVGQLDPRLRIHDFRFVEGSTHTNLIFDVAAPFELEMTDAEIVKNVGAAAARLGNNYFAVITVDRE